MLLLHKLTEAAPQRGRLNFIIRNFAGDMGKEGGFENLYRLHYRPLCLYALHYVSDLETAEDVVQDCFLGLLGKNPDSPKAYLYAAVRNRCIDCLRREAAASNAATGLNDTATDEPAMEDIIARSESEARLWSIVESLPKQRRRCLLMAKRDGLSYKEIAEELGLSERTVRNHISRALEFLRDTDPRALLFVLSFFA